MEKVTISLPKKKRIKPEPEKVEVEIEEKKEIEDKKEKVEQPEPNIRH
jgi:hypothetical protein